MKRLTKPPIVLIAVILVVVLFAGVAMFVTQQESRNGHEFPPKVYFGEIASASELLVQSARTSSIDLSGKWVIESINSEPVAPAADWLEQPAVAHTEFKVNNEGAILTGYSGCNGFGGKVYVLDGKLQTPELTMTQRWCGGGPLLSQENTLLHVLSSTGVWGSLQTLSESAIIVGTEETGFVQLKRMDD